MIDEEKFKRVSQRIDSYREAMIELQIALSGVSAVGPENGGDGELFKVRFIEKSPYPNWVLKISGIMTRRMKEFLPVSALISLRQ